MAVQALYSSFPIQLSRYGTLCFPCHSSISPRWSSSTTCPPLKINMAVQRTAAFYLSPSAQRVRPIYVHSRRPWWQAVKVCRHYELRDRICHLTSNRTVTINTARSTLLLCLYGLTQLDINTHPPSYTYILWLPRYNAHKSAPEGLLLHTQLCKMKYGNRRGKARCMRCVHLPAHSVAGTPTT